MVDSQDSDDEDIGYQYEEEPESPEPSGSPKRKDLVPQDDEDNDEDNDEDSDDEEDRQETKHMNELSGLIWHRPARSQGSCLPRFVRDFAVLNSDLVLANRRTLRYSTILSMT